MIRFVLLLLVLAAVLYALFWAIDRRNSAGGSSGRPVPRGPLGPDDDDEFLRSLDPDRTRHDQDPPAP